ncbi:MAG: hypothetical protein LCH41_14105 [Armatimonadetes bacterium]|nr:hypothetical protein [Armatimonadota bacterium]
MNEKTKQALAIVAAIVAVGVAAFMGVQALGTPGGDGTVVVGELPMGEGGGRDAEAGASGAPAADPVSGMPADKAAGN